MSEPAAVVLAAGASRRFGADKLASAVTLNGLQAPLLVHALRPWLEVFERVTLVLRPEGTALRSLLLAGGHAARINFVICENSAQGLSASLARGVKAEADAGGWLIGLADMPCIPASAIAAVREAIAAGAAIAAPYVDTRRGHPVGFAAHYYNELTSLSGDQGARSLLERDRGLIQPVDIADRGILLDIDEPGDMLGLH